MTRIELDINGITYSLTDEHIVLNSVKETMNEALISETLSIDTMAFEARTNIMLDDPLKDSTESVLHDINLEVLYSYDASFLPIMNDYKYGDIVRLYHNNALKGKYYLTKVAKSDHDATKLVFSCESFLGILSHSKHRGGIYFSKNAGEIIAEIMGTQPYSIDSELYNTPLSGWLPNDTALANLTQVLFACGASILRDANYDLVFTYNLPDTALVFDESETYLGGNVKASDSVTVVKLTEHTYYNSAELAPTVLFDNASGVVANRIEIVFNQPYHTLVGTGITIHSSGDNYAIISGVGTLTGIPYIHMQRVIETSTGVSGEPRELSSNKCTLISSVNSEITLQRLANYYSQTTEAELSILSSDEKAGSRIEAVNPTDISNRISGYIKSISKLTTGIAKSTVKITQGWFPKYVGNDFNAYAMIDIDTVINGKFNPPAEAVGKPGLLMIFGGSQGGQGGYYGETPARFITGEREDIAVPGITYGNRYVGKPAPHGQTGGAGGKGGKGGNVGKTLSVRLASIASSYNVTLGTGGAGGSGGTVSRALDEERTLTFVQPTEGTYGTHTVFGTYDTDNGSFLSGADIVNIVTGEILARGTGNTGTAGGKGGNGHDSVAYIANVASGYDPVDDYRGQAGQNVGAYRGGNGGGGDYGRITSNVMFPVAGGGGGGGAALGSNGSNGIGYASFHTQDYTYYSGESEKDTFFTPPRWYIYGLDGGDGANATGIPAAAAKYTGGTGGGGGGGGGGAGAPHGYVGRDDEETGVFGIAEGGKGGNGGTGGSGSAGWGILYYKVD